MNALVKNHHIRDVKRESSKLAKFTSPVLKSNLASQWTFLLITSRHFGTKTAEITRERQFVFLEQYHHRRDNKLFFQKKSRATTRPSITRAPPIRAAPTASWKQVD